MRLLGSVTMNMTQSGGAAPNRIWRLGSACVAAVIGIAFFFLIIGVFGLPQSIAALVLFLVCAVLVFRRRQIEGDGS